MNILTVKLLSVAAKEFVFSRDTKRKLTAMHFYSLDMLVLGFSPISQSLKDTHRFTWRFMGKTRKLTFLLQEMLTLNCCFKTTVMFLQD